MRNVVLVRHLARAIVLVSTTVTTRATAAQVVAPDSAALRERRAFDFLVGRWRVTARSDSRASAFDETYEFEQALDGALLTGRWRFNRGTTERPDYVTAAYFSAYDNRSRAWSFYYVSPQSAQYWPGTRDGGRWRFVRPFTLGDTAFVQRQSWTRVDGRTIERHIETSPDSGRTWRPLTIRLHRVP